MEEFGSFIDGKPAIPAAPQKSEVVGPVTGLPYATAPVSGPDDVGRAIEATERVFASWRVTTPPQRQRALLRLTDAMEARAEELMEVANTGKPAALTRSEELPPMVDQIRFFAGAARQLGGKWSTWPATHPGAGRTLE